ncbi:hypothetical protein [Lacticaseibacillus sp. GG6-2]
MPLFHSHLTQQLQHRLHTLFPTSALYYIQLADQAHVSACFQHYTQAFTDANITKQLGLITVPDAGIVPYLTVRSNILINGQHQSFDLLPEAMRKDTLFLDADASTISAAQSLYVQLFRNLLAGRQFLLMRDFPETMTPQETRLFLDCAQEAVHATNAHLIILTTDAGLIAANPTTSWTTAPQLVHQDATA